MTADPAKRAAALAAAALVEEGMTVGLGTGSTAAYFVTAVADLVDRGMRLGCVATSSRTAALAAARGVPLIPLPAGGVDLAVDGADCVAPDLSLIKGAGGAHVRERVVASAARRFVVVVDQTKLSDRLVGPVPVELLEFGIDSTLHLLSRAGAVFRIRSDGSGQPVRSEDGNLLADGNFGPIEKPGDLAADLDRIPGLVGHGLFLAMAERVVVGQPDGHADELLALE